MSGLVQTSRNILCRSLLLCYMVVLPLAAFADSGIRADWLVDRHYLSPGESVDLIFEVTNPIDSEFEIHDYLGGSNFSSIATVSEHFVRSPHPQECEANYFCAVDGGSGYPILPGETRRFFFARLVVKENAPSNAELLISDVSLKPRDANYRRSNDVHFERNYLAIVTPDGSGDAGYLASRNTENERAGSAQISAELQLSYPERVLPGEAIEVLGTLINRGNETISDYFLLGSTRHRGEHANSFKQVSCHFKCSFSGSFPLQESESIDLLFRQLYYVNDWYIGGRLRIEGPYAIVSDELSRSAYVYADDVEVSIDPVFPLTGIPRPRTGIPLRAELFPFQDQGPMRHQLVVDPNTGIGWLPLSETAGVSLDYAIEQTRTGGIYEGFTVANSQEVETLILNHIWASGESLADYELYGGSQIKHVTSATFIDLVGATSDTGDGSRFARGFVSDTPEYGNEAVTIDVRHISYTSPPLPYQGVGHYWIESTSQSTLAETGIWLLKEEVDFVQESISFEKKGRQAEAAHYEYGQLILASVEVEAVRYQLTFNLIKGEENLLELASVLDEYNREPAATYDVESLVLKIPRLAYYVFPDSYSYFAVELEAIPGTAPPQFRILSATPVDDVD